MAIPEFISVLRKIRDVIYPEVKTLYDNSLVLKNSIDVGKAEFDADFTLFGTQYNDFITKKGQVDTSVTSANNSALSASQSAQIATDKSNEIKAITAQSTTGAPGTNASASYNPTDGKFTFIIPQGSKGDKGESFTVNSSGITASRTLYDAQPTGWSFLDVTTSTLYFKVSNTSGDWSTGVPFGKGDTGATGAQGVGITSFTFVSTTDVSGLPAKSGATDTYRVTLTNANTFDYQVYNGLDASLEYVDTQVGNVQTNLNTTNTLINSHISLNASYHLLGGNLSVDATVLTNGFGTTLYTGNGTTQSINTGIDMSTQWGNTTDETYGGLVWLKNRNGTVSDHRLTDTVRGVTKSLSLNGTYAEYTETTGLTAFNNNGFSIGALIGINGNTQLQASWNFQTTHKRTGTTNHGKTFTEHYNPFTGFTIIKYEGSGLAGHELPHSLGRKLGFVITKDLATTTDWYSYLDGFGVSDFLTLNTTIAKTTTGTNTVVVDSNNNSIALGTGSINATNTHILYGWANSYFDESGKLIGNFEIGVYQGTGVAGNKVVTRGKPAWIMIKRLDSTSGWYIHDNQRNNFDANLQANLSSVEATGNWVDSTVDGFIVQGTNLEHNASGGQYLHMVVYDNDNGSGKSKYPKAADTANVQINNGIIPLAHGIDSNRSKNSIVVANETITGVTYTEGKNYLYRHDIGYGVKPYKERKSPSELIRKFAGEQPDYYDVKSNKWFNCDAGTELVTNGTFSSGVTTGWTAVSSTLSVVNNTLRVTSNSASYGQANGEITTVIGKRYKIQFTINAKSNTQAGVYIESLSGIINNGNLANTTVAASVASYALEFIAQTTTTYIKLVAENVSGYWAQFDDISVFPIDIVPTTEITESRNYMNHIVHADADGGVLYVEELPKIEYKNVIKAEEYLGKNACTLLATVNCATTPPTILESYGKNISIIRTTTGEYDLYTDVFDTLNAQCFVNIRPSVSGLANTNFIYQTSYNRFHITHIENGTSQNGLTMHIHIDGGRK